MSNRVYYPPRLTYLADDMAFPSIQKCVCVCVSVSGCLACLAWANLFHKYKFNLAECYIKYLLNSPLSDGSDTAVWAVAAETKKFIQIDKAKKKQQQRTL